MTDDPSGAADRLLAQARRRLQPPVEARTRVLAATLATVAVPDPTLGSGEPAPAHASSAVAQRVLSVLGIAAASAGVGYHVGLGRGRAEATSERPPVSAAVAPTNDSAHVATPPAMVASPPALDAPDAPSHLEPGRASGSVARATPSSTPERDSASTLEEELRLLRRVERAQRQGNARLALTLLEELDEKLPVSGLGEERAAAGVVARCTLRYGSRALLAADFSARYPASIHLGRVNDACAETPTTSEPHEPRDKE